MTRRLERRADGSLTLTLDGDLQFDSRDECIYHEALALPALALAERAAAGGGPATAGAGRDGEGLRALICGGGDGLVARELLKSSAMGRLDLVEIDPAMVALARTELATLNRGSLDDARLVVHLGDAWAFVAAAARAGARYDVVVCDLTVPQDAAGARFHCLNWYEWLRSLLGERGVLAVNAVSPSARPAAYWGIYNTLRVAGLHPRPYRVALPSFAAAGYGPDWGFLLGSPAPIPPEAFGDDLPLAGPRLALRDAAQLRRLGHFPAAGAAHRLTVPPVVDGAAFLQALAAHAPAAPAPAPDGGAWAGLAFDVDSAPVPPAGPARLIPAELAPALAEPAPTEREAAAGTARVVERVLALVPALQPGQTRAMVAEFLAEPGRFLAGLDLFGLVERLLRRAAELPPRLVAELRRLRRRLLTWDGDDDGLLRLGLRVVTIIVVVVILANLAFPDTVYGKGGGTGGSGGHVSVGQTSGISHPSTAGYGLTDSTPGVARGNGFRDGRGGLSTDETGSLFPARTYYYSSHYYSSHYSSSSYPRSGSGGVSPTPTPMPPSGATTQPGETAVYRLTPETDLLADGQVVVALTDGAFMSLGSAATAVIDQSTGESVVDLAPEPAQLWRVGQELERQRLGLEQTAGMKAAWIAWVSWLDFAPWHEADRQELANLRAMAAHLGTARDRLGNLPATEPASPQPPATGAVELFAGAWGMRDGSAVLLRRPDGPAYLDGAGWFRDAARQQPLAEPYPAALKTILTALLTQRQKDSDATLGRLQRDVLQADTDRSALLSDQSEYAALRKTTPDGDMVDYGSQQIPLGEAWRRTNDDLARVQLQLDRLRAQVAAFPAETDAVNKLLATLRR